MIWCSSLPAVERAQPWLGTLVSIRVEGLPSGEAHAALDGALSQVALVHRLMSFRDPSSDVGRINQAGPGTAVEVHPFTHAVLRQAMQLSAASSGCFDVTIGAELVEWGYLPQPLNACPNATWRDIELMDGNRVRLHRPLWVDLGGIAKGFAVDLAIQCLMSHGALQAVVNAGGDIRVCGPERETIQLGACDETGGAPLLEIADGSVASSTGTPNARTQAGRCYGPHVNGRDRRPADPRRFVSVIAPGCMVADALTKVVLALDSESAEVLQRFDAFAYMHHPEEGWRSIGQEMEALP